MSVGKSKIIIATRGSKLALWQANWIRTELEKRNSGLSVELKKIKTTGDKILDVPLAKVGGKGLFVKEIEDALLKKRADLAVHSMKDVPVDLPSGLHIGAVCEREDPRDAFITPVQRSAFSVRRFKDLPQGATVGTSSLRRMCQVLSIRPDIRIVQLRGNLDTRIRKLDEGQFDAIIVASAGVKRLGMAARIKEILATDISLPAIGQGAVGIECRTDDGFIQGLIAPLDHYETAVCVRAEREFLKRLEGGCQVPIAAYARLISRGPTPPDTPLPKGGRGGPADLPSPGPQPHTGNSLLLDGLVGSITGDTIVRDAISGRPEDAEELGIHLAEKLIARGAGRILDEVYGRSR